MLALGRKEGETVTITVPPSAEPVVIVVEVVRVKRTQGGGKAVIGFESQHECEILRSELLGGDHGK